MPTRPRPQKSRSGSPGDTRPRPLVGPGAPPRRRPARPATHPPRPRHRLVALATRPPGRRTALTPEAKNATVVLGRALNGGIGRRGERLGFGWPPRRTD